MTTPYRRYRILVTGWRDWPIEGAWYVHRILDQATIVIPTTHQVTIVDGECIYGGVDLWAHQWAIEHYGPEGSERHPARLINGKIEGPARNTHMVNLGADLCLAFPGPNSRGTKDCARKAEAAGILTFPFPWKEEYRLAPRRQPLE